MLISDVLQTKGHEVFTIRPEQTVKEAVERLAAHRIGALVVEEHGKPAGVFSERDLVNSLARSGVAVYGHAVRELMSSPVVTGAPGDTTDHAMSMMVGQRIRHLPIVGPGGLAGMVTLGDLIKHRLDQKELEADVLLDISRMHS